MSHNIIPIPVEWVETGADFRLNAETIIVVDTSELVAIGNVLSEKIRQRLGLVLRVEVGAAGSISGNSIRLNVVDEGDLGAEGYRLTISDAGVVLTGGSAAGLFYGVQTLGQLLPIRGEPVLNGCVIRDTPRFAYRGAMLDVARHFFSVADVKHLIDLMALYKFNRLHLHLTDDQGWRIEIKSWPNLTAHGSQSQVGDGVGGFYTQAEFSEIVGYAAARYIEVVPEIDMPGHTNAALSSYPVLTPDGVTAPPPYRGTEVGFSTLTVAKDITYQFIDDVVREIAALSPSRYLHIGGDESHVTPLEEYRVFIQRVQAIVLSHGKTMIGWEEIGQAPLALGTVAQHWFSDFARQAVAQGGKVICSPASKIYLDMKYDESCPLGLAWAGFSDTKNAYTWEPATLMEGVAVDDIVGIEAPLWTETILTRADMEYMIFPRLLGVAEIGWSPAAARDWEAYRFRLAAHGRFLQALGVNFYRDPVVDWDAVS